MSDRVHIGLVVAASVLLLYAGLNTINTQVSLKYEVGDDPCLSMVSGRNLCADFEQMKWLCWAAFGVVVALISFSNQLIRKK